MRMTNKTRFRRKSPDINQAMTKASIPMKGTSRTNPVVNTCSRVLTVFFMRLRYVAVILGGGGSTNSRSNRGVETGGGEVCGSTGETTDGSGCGAVALNCFPHFGHLTGWSRSFAEHFRLARQCEQKTRIDSLDDCFMWRSFTDCAVRITAQTHPMGLSDCQVVHN